MFSLGTKLFLRRKSLEVAFTIPGEKAGLRMISGQLSGIFLRLRLN